MLVCIRYTGGLVNLPRSGPSASRREDYTMARRRDPVLSEALSLDFRATRMALKATIRAARNKSWNQLCNAVENDPWGLPYRVVTKNLATHPPGTEVRGREMVIADHLFPQLPTIDWSQSPLEDDIDADEDTPKFNTDELETAARRLPSGFCRHRA